MEEVEEGEGEKGENKSKRGGGSRGKRGNTSKIKDNGGTRRERRRVNCRKKLKREE